MNDLNLRNVIYETQRGNMPRIIAVGATSAAAQAGVAAGRNVQDELARKLFKALDLNLIPASRLKRVNTMLAVRAQDAMVSGWRATLPAKAPGYRRGPDPQKDRLSNLLGPALASSNMLMGTTDRTISFLNVQYLGTEARHWYRVNYGAYGPKATPKEPKSFAVNIGGHTLFNLKDRNRPAANSWLPRLYVATPVEYFQPKQGPADVVGGGTRSANFTDLGFKRLARDFGPYYRSMFADYVKEAGKRAELRKAGVRVSKQLTKNVWSLDRRS